MKQRFFLPLQTCDKESINLVLHDFRRDCFNRFQLGDRNDRGFLSPSLCAGNASILVGLQTGMSVEQP